MSTDDLSNPYLIERVRDALARDERCGVLGVVVRLLPGHLCLSGAVPTMACRESVALVAREIAGALRVVNETIVTPSPDPGCAREVLA